jgi:DNA-binding SARP family transcriptional activator/predicted ATPase
MLTLRLLGPPEATLDSAPLRVARRKSRALVYYVAAHERPVPRGQLLALLWPDLERPAAQQSLRTTLHGLRKALGPALGIDDDQVWLAPVSEVDVRAFAAGLAAPGVEALEAALRLYRGEFLQGFSLPEPPGFDDWAAAERERYRRLAVRGLAALAEQHESAGSFAAALEALERALAIEPLQEDLQRTALRLDYLAGDRPGAIRRYARLRELLDEELGVLPMAETRALYDAILTDSVRPAQVPPRPPGHTGERQRPRPPLQPAHTDAGSDDFTRPHGWLEFVGRQRELKALRALASAPGPKRLALLEGEPGIGKTRLAGEFMRAECALALRAAARELEQTLPHQPVIEALRGLLARPDWPGLFSALRPALAEVWLAEVGRLLPELHPGPAPASPNEARLWEAVHQFLSALASQQAVCIFFDDLQWADASTLALLNYLLRRAEAGSAPITWLAAARPVQAGTPAAALLQALTREGRLLRLPLERLGQAEAARLAHQGLGGHAGPADVRLAAWLAEASEGNPFMLAELLHHLRDDGLLGPDGQPDWDALGQSPVVPHTVYSLVQSRLARLSDPARRVVDAAVAAGREFAFEVVYRAAGLSESAGLDALDELLAAGLVAPAAAAPAGADEPAASLTSYAFDHSLTMEVAYREAGEARHRIQHRRVAEAFEQVLGRRQCTKMAGVLAAHFAEGNAPQRAAPYAQQAAELAAGLAAWAEAIGFYRLALAAAETPRQRLPILMALGAAHEHSGNAALASEIFGQARQAAEDAGDEPAHRAARAALARSYLSQARFSEAVALAHALCVSAATPDDQATAEFIWGAALSIEGGDLAGAAEHLEAAEALLRQWPEAPNYRLAQVAFEQGGVAAQLGDLQRANSLYRQALDLASQDQDEESLGFRVLAHNNLAYHLHLLDPADPAASEQAQAGLALAQERGLMPLLTWLHSTAGEIALARGDLQAAEAHFDEGLDLARRLLMPERMAGLTANLGRLALARGDACLALYRLSTALAEADALGTHHLAANIRLWLAPLLPPAEARQALARVRAFAEASGRALLLRAVEGA